VEVKNLNSIRNVKRAIDVEAARLISLLKNGEEIRQQTRSFDANNGTTFSIRDKEDADDYRYFADPDLTPFHLEDSFIEQVRASIPVLQEERIKKYTALQLTEYDATVLTEDKPLADYFETVIHFSPNCKAAANWMLGPVKTWLNEHNQEITGFPIAAAQLAKLIQLVDDGKLSFSMASSRLFSELLKAPDKDPEEIATENNLLQQSDASALVPVVDAVLEKLAAKVVEYKKGKKGLLSLFVGEVMKQTRGKADPKLTNELLLERLNSI
jgi:aspartyl-tRNA(Asn)/glutamyl-tRNA(Gln) amidotransferase subunit B